MDDTEVQCINCRFADRPTKRCACNVKTKHELLNAEPMRWRKEDGLPYCDCFRPKRAAETRTKNRTGAAPKPKRKK